MTASASSTTDFAGRAQIDASLKLPVLVFFGSAIFWLLAGSFLGLFAAWKLYFPGLCDCLGFLTYGRVQPAAVNALVYGWASMAGLGAGLWLMARLSGAPLIHTRLLVVAAKFWNLGVLLGVLGILAGQSRSIPLLEFPAYASIVLLVAYACIAVWGLELFRRRTTEGVYVSQWYLVAAFLCFPWAYGTANLLLVWHPVRGSAQGAIGAWYEGALGGLWLASLALAVIFYLVPKLIGRPVFSHTLNVLAFWSLVLFSAWKGLGAYNGGPFPVWMVSAGVVASVLLIVPVLAIWTNLHLTLRASYEMTDWSPALRFAVAGLGAFLLTTIVGALLALPGVASVLNFSDFITANFLLGLLGFVTLSFCGAIYFIIPRLARWEWPSIELIRWHFWLVACGVGLGFLSLALGGLVQGFALYDPGVQFMASVGLAAPFRFTAAVCAVAFFAGNLVFAVHFARMLLKDGTGRGPAFFASGRKPEEAVV